jgi:hypothetical protein
VIAFPERLPQLSTVALGGVGEDQVERASFLVGRVVAQLVEFERGAEVAGIGSIEVAGHDNERPDADTAALGRRDDCMSDLVDGGFLADCVTAEFSYVSASG